MNQGIYKALVLITLTLLILVSGISSAPVRTVLSRASSCEQVIMDAYQVTEELCQKTGRNQVCYGHTSLDATPQPDIANFTFAEEGDIANVADMQTLRLSAMDTVSNNWGVALMRFQANIANDQPNKNATLLLFGNVQLESKFSKPSVSMDLSVTPNGNVNIRHEPSTSATIIGIVKAGQLVTVTGRLEDTSWLRVQIPDTQALGWISRTLIPDVEDRNLAALEVVDAGPQYGPMQAFYFNSSDRGDVCPEAPDSGILIQTPEGVAEITLLINEIDVQIGSTVYFRAVPGGNMTVSVVEGLVYVETDGQTVGIPAGSEATIPLNEDMKPAGPPNQAHGYNMDQMNLLPVELLERDITIHQPLTDAEIYAALHPPVEDVVAEEVHTNNGNGNAGNGNNGNSSHDNNGNSNHENNGNNGNEGNAPPQEEKVTICHKGNTISIDAVSVPDHLGHGDTLGACPA